MTAAWRMWELSDLTAPWALRVVVTLGVPDLVAEGVDTGDALAARTGADRDALVRLIRHLAARDVFTEPEPGRFALTDAGRTLCAGDGSRLHEWLDLRSAAGRMDEVYSRLLLAVRTGGPAYADVHGKSLWDDLAADPERQRSFDDLMTGDSTDYWAMIADRDWSAVAHVVDVGGGQGELLTRILGAHPHVRGTLFELPGTLDGAPAVLAVAGVSGRCALVGGSFFDAVPSGGDLYVLASVLHNWNDDDATTILRRTAEAAGPGGRVLVVEGVTDDSTGTTWATHLDLKMLVLLGGRERTTADFTELARRVGLAEVGVERRPRGPFGLGYAVLEYRRPA